MAKLNIKINPINEAISIHEQYAGIAADYADPIIPYLDQYEPYRLKILLNQANEIEKEFMADKDLGKLRKALSVWVENWHKAYDSLSVNKTQVDLARIHKLQITLKINQYDYRNILMFATGKQSAANMRYYEIKLAERALHDFAAGKINPKTWEVNNV